MEKLDLAADAVNTSLTGNQELALRMMCDCQRQLVLDDLGEYGPVLERLGSELSGIPPLYGQEGLHYDSRVRAHYFVGATDIFITEMSLEDDCLFGFAILNGDYEMAEFGYFSLSELRSVPMLNLDFFWVDVALREALGDVDDYFADL